jgi:hypothetical protein
VILAKRNFRITSALLATATIGTLLAQPHSTTNDTPFNQVLFFGVSGSMTKTLGGAGSPARHYLADHMFASPAMFREGWALSAYNFAAKCRPGPAFTIIAVHPSLCTGPSRLLFTPVSVLGQVVLLKAEQQLIGRSGVMP